ncbi:MAG: hypothetical protein JXQ76_06025, partial [Campylobacterales bacterium]|nr:hypothetical protein [Campylobacterales bacterium]
MVRVWIICLLFGQLLYAAALQTFTRSTPNETAFDSVTTQWNNPNDDDYITVNLGFAFSFAGNEYTQVHISTNGVLSFDLSATFDNDNQQLPYHAPTIYPYWDMLDPTNNQYPATITYGTLGSVNNHRFVVTWRNVGFTNNASFYGQATFQVVLYENGD